MSLFTELFQPGMLILLGIIIITFSILVIYIQYIVQEQNHKLKQMVSLISSLAEELNNVKNENKWSSFIQPNNIEKVDYQEDENELISVSTEEEDSFSEEEDQDDSSTEEDDSSEEENDCIANGSFVEYSSFPEEVENSIEKEFILENNDINIEYSFHPEDKSIDLINPMKLEEPTDITESNYENMNLTELRKRVVSKQLCLMNHAKKLKKEQLIELLEKV